MVKFWARGLRFLRCERGVAAVEAALVLPVMIIFMFASLEVYQYFRVAGLMNRAAFSVVDSVASQQQLYEGGPCDLTDHLCTYGTLAADLMKPVDFATDGHMAIGLYVAETVDGVTNWAASPAWSQDCSVGGGCSSTTELDTLPAGMPAAKPTDEVLIVKLFQKYQPFVISARVWTGLGGSVNLTTVAFTRARSDTLRTLQ